MVRTANKRRILQIPRCQDSVIVALNLVDDAGLSLTKHNVLSEDRRKGQHKLKV